MARNQNESSWTTLILFMCFLVLVVVKTCQIDSENSPEESISDPKLPWIIE